MQTTPSKLSWLITATEIFCLNELGKRPNNEDAVAPIKGTATLHDKIFVVCDGVGGESKGEIASALVAGSILEYFKNHSSSTLSEKASIQKAIYYANQQLAAYAITDASAKRMSTTLALVYLGENSVHIAWCGDTRVHHIRNGEVLWKSQDHSLVGELVSQGELTEEEARSHPKRNIITRSLNALNFNNTIDFHVVTEVTDNDYFLLCSDGFLEQINEKALREVLTNNQSDKAAEFFTLCDGLTRDNFSMYLIRVKNLADQTGTNAGHKLLWILLFLVGSILMLFFLIKRN